MNKAKLSEIEKAFLQISSLQKTPDEVPEGWWTSEEYGALKSVSQSTANKHIKLLLQRGLVRSQKFLILCQDKALHRVPHYRTSDSNDEPSSQHGKASKARSRGK